ncbi:MAG: aspartate aminotransferase family protein [bacterium]|nr:aspartate aminotransferase family protein [bacterium]
MSESFEFPVYKRLDLEIVEGSGSRVRTSGGRELIDFYGGHAVAALGYRHAGMLEVLREQAERLHFQTNLVELEVRHKACEDLARLAPPGLDRVFLVNSGAEANENALRLAFRERDRDKVVAVEGGFHGRTAAAGACSHGRESWYAFPRAPFDVVWAPPDDRQALAAAVDDRTAAVILEPVQGLAGSRELSTEFLQVARVTTERHGAWLIADEVQCGMGRTGTAFAIDAAGVVPDVITTAKGLAGGFPAGAVIAPARIADSLPPGALGTTFGGGPLACVWISTVIEHLEASGFLERVRHLGERIRHSCRIGPVVDVQGRGLLLGLRCDRPATQVLAELRHRGILAGGATDPEIVRLMPPLNLEDADACALEEALADIPAKETS